MSAVTLLRDNPRLQSNQLSTDEKRLLQKEYTGNWVVRAVSALLDTENFNAAPKWVAQKLDISLDEAVSALDTLEKLGIIRRTEAGYEKVLKYVYFSDRDLDPMAVLADHALISTQIMGRLDPSNPTVGSFYRTGFVASDRKRMKEFFLKLEQLMKEFLVESNGATNEDVYAFTLSGVCLTQEDVK